MVNFELFFSQSWKITRKEGRRMEQKFSVAEQHLKLVSRLRNPQALPNSRRRNTVGWFRRRESSHTSGKKVMGALQYSAQASVQAGPASSSLQEALQMPSEEPATPSCKKNREFNHPATTICHNVISHTRNMIYRPHNPQVRSCHGRGHLLQGLLFKMGFK